MFGSVEDYTRRLVAHQRHLGEKILIFDAELDDRVVEVAKAIAAMELFGEEDPPADLFPFQGCDGKELRNPPKDDESLRAKAKDRWYVPDPNKVGDLEKLRERSLLKEFEECRASSQKRLKLFRLEAVRAGFKKDWQERDYATIIAVAREIPESVLQEDPKLLMWYDQALTRTGGDS